MPNPIISVDGKPVPPPSRYVWKLADVSAEDAGRTEDMKMHKNRIGQAVTCEYAWKYVSTAVASQILKAFNPEYVDLVYIDPYEGGEKESIFYVDDRTAPMYNCALDLWEEISFTVIQQLPDPSNG